jgi:lipid-binding SYLF domain-containing protein
MFRSSVLGACVLLVAAGVYAANKEEERLQNCGTVMEEITHVPDNIPQELLEKANCVVVIPSVVKIAVGIGGSYGRGAMVCRTGSNYTGPSWGAPAMMALEGGSIGLQLGGQATDFVLLVMNERGANAILSSKVKLGAEASVAAGPVGRNAQAATDASLRAEILAYSRNRGLFAGVSLDGTTLRPDDEANQKVYGRKISSREIVTGSGVTVPEAGRKLVQVLEKVAHRKET